MCRAEGTRGTTLLASTTPPRDAPNRPPMQGSLGAEHGAQPT